MFSVFLWLLGYVRVTDTVEEWRNLPFVTGANLTQFIKENKIAVVFYQDEKNKGVFGFADYAMSKFPSIKFAVSTAKDSQSLSFHFLPNVKAFVRGKPYERDAIQRPIAFHEFCRSLALIDEPVRLLTTLESLRAVLEEPRSVLLDIDECNLPSNRKKGDVLYCTSSLLMRYFGLNVSSGYHVYRGQDRQLLPAKEQYRQYMKSYLSDIKTTNLSTRPFFAGYFMDDSDPKQNEMELSILAKLSANAELRTNFNIGPIVGLTSVIFSEAGAFNFIQWPLFAVLVTQGEEEAGRRWAVADASKMHDLAFLTGFLARIADGTEPVTVISSAINTSDSLSINCESYWQFVKGDGLPSVVAFLSEEHPAAGMWAAILREAERLLHGVVKFYEFDASRNDLPVNATVKELPTVYLYHHGKEDTAVRYTDLVDADAFLEWVAMECQVSLPEYDSASLKQRMAESDEL